MAWGVSYKDGEEENALYCKKWAEDGSFLKCVQRWRDSITENEHQRVVLIPLVNVRKIEEI